MVKYRIGIKGIDWTKLTELYGEVGLVGGYGKKKDANKIREAFQASGKVVTAWDNEKLEMSRFTSILVFDGIRRRWPDTPITRNTWNEIQSEVGGV